MEHFTAACEAIKDERTSHEMACARLFDLLPGAGTAPGFANTFLGLGAGNFTMTGGDNTASGYGALGEGGAGSR